LSELDLPKRLLEFGDKPGAVTELTRMLQVDPDNIDAWFLMVDAIDDPTKKTDCYHQILRIDPGNQFAQIHLQKLDRRPFISQIAEEDTPQTARRAEMSEFRSAVVKKKPVKTVEQGLFGMDYQTTLLVGIVVFVVVVLLLLFFIVMVSGVMQPPPPPTPTRIHLPPTWTPMPM
jgi:hypothetical protein